MPTLTGINPRWAALTFCSQFLPHTDVFNQRSQTVSFPLPRPMALLNLTEYFQTRDFPLRPRKAGTLGHRRPAFSRGCGWGNWQAARASLGRGACHKHIRATWLPLALAVLLPEVTCLLPAGTSFKPKVQVFVSSIRDLFITIGTWRCAHIWNVNWEQLIQKKSQYMRRIRTQRIVNSKPTKLSWITN